MLNANSDRVVSHAEDTEIFKTMDFIIQEVLRDENVQFMENYLPNQKESSKTLTVEHINSNKCIIYGVEAEISGTMDFIIEEVLRSENFQCQNDSTKIEEEKSESSKEVNLDSAMNFFKRSKIIPSSEDDNKGNEKDFEYKNNVTIESEATQDHAPIIKESKSKNVANIANDMTNLCYEDADCINQKKLFVKALGLETCVNASTSSLSHVDATVDDSQNNYNNSPDISKVKNIESVHFNSPIAVVHEYIVSQTSEACSTQPLFDEDIDDDKDLTLDTDQFQEMEVKETINHAKQVEKPLYFHSDTLSSVDSNIEIHTFDKCNQNKTAQELLESEKVVDAHHTEEIQQNLKKQHKNKSDDCLLKSFSINQSAPYNLKDLCSVVCERLIMIKEGNSEKTVMCEDNFEKHKDEKTDLTQNMDKVNELEVALIEYPKHISKENTKTHKSDTFIIKESEDSNYGYCRKEFMTPGGDAFSTIQTNRLSVGSSHQNITYEIETIISENKLDGKELEDLKKDAKENKLHAPFCHIVPVKEIFSKEPTGCSKLLDSPDLFIDNDDCCEKLTHDEEGIESQKDSIAKDLEDECISNNWDQHNSIDELVEDGNLEKSKEENLEMKNQNKLDNDNIETKNVKVIDEEHVETIKIEKEVSKETFELIPENKEDLYIEGKDTDTQNKVDVEHFEVELQTDKRTKENENKINEESIESKLEKIGDSEHIEKVSENKIIAESMGSKFDDDFEKCNDNCRVEIQNENNFNVVSSDNEKELGDDLIKHNTEQSQEKYLIPTASRKRKLFHSNIEVDHSLSKMINLGPILNCSTMDWKQPVALRVLAKQTIDKSEELTLWSPEDIKVDDSSSFVESQAADEVHPSEDFVKNEEAITTRDNDSNEAGDALQDEPYEDSAHDKGTDTDMDSSQDKRKGAEYQGFISATEHLSQTSQGSSTGFVYHPGPQEEKTNSESSSQNSINGVMVIPECFDVKETSDGGHSNQECIECHDEGHEMNCDFNDLDSYIDRSIDQMVPGEEINISNNHGEETDIQAPENKIPLYTCDIDLYDETDKSACNQGVKIDQCKPMRRGEFKWKYAPSVDLESNPTCSSDLDLEDQVVGIIPLKTCGKPIRLGLSKKQSLVHLHRINQNKT